MIFLERERKEKKREKNKNLSTQKTPLLFFFSLLFLNFSSFSSSSILFPSVRVRYLLYNKRTRLFGTLYYDYKSTLLLLDY